jgi:hypothetical protein
MRSVPRRPATARELQESCCSYLAYRGRVPKALRRSQSNVVLRRRPDIKSHPFTFRPYRPGQARDIISTLSLYEPCLSQQRRARVANDKLSRSYVRRKKILDLDQAATSLAPWVRVQSSVRVVVCNAIRPREGKGRRIWRMKASTGLLGRQKRSGRYQCILDEPWTAANEAGIGACSCKYASGYKGRGIVTRRSVLPESSKSPEDQNFAPQPAFRSTGSSVRLIGLRMRAQVVPLRLREA